MSDVIIFTNPAATAANVAGDFTSNSILQNLLNNHGADVAAGAVKNVLGITLGDFAKQVINEAPLPQFMKDGVNDAIDQAIAGERAAVPAAAESEAKESLSEITQDIMSRAKEELDEELKNSDGSSKTQGGGGNWLTVLARAMGEVAGKHLERALKLADEISSMGEATSDEMRFEQGKQMTALQAEMQAETQMFKLTQEAATTLVKSVGEALTATARKQ